MWKECAAFKVFTPFSIASKDYLKIWRGQCPAAPDLLSKVEDVEDRECHLIERFKFVPRDEEWAIELTYKEFGDALPSEVQKSVEHLLEEWAQLHEHHVAFHCWAGICFGMFWNICS